MARFCGSVGPTDQRPCPCLGCGSYYARLGSHVDRCELCQERGLTKEIHLRMIKQYDSMHIVFQGHVGRGGKRDGTSWYVGYSDPRLVKEHEESTIITVDNPLHDPSVRSTESPQNPERIRILPSGLARVEEIRQGNLADRGGEGNRRDQIDRQGIQESFIDNNDFMVPEQDYHSPPPQEEADVAQIEDTTSGQQKLQMLLPILLKMEPNLRDELIKVLVQSPQSVNLDTIYSGRHFEEYLEIQNALLGWKSREIIRLKPPEGCEEIAIDVYFMEDARTVLQKLLKKEEARGMKFQFKEERVQKEDHADFNQRIFGELYMGDRMKELEENLDSYLNKMHRKGNGYILPLAFYSDKTQSGRQSQIMYPLNVYIPAFPVNSARSSGCYERIGLLPTFEKHGLNFLTSKEKKLVTQWTTLQSMRCILESFKKLSYRGVQLEDIDGNMRWFYPIPVFVSGDWQEYQLISGLGCSTKPDEDTFPDVQTLASGFQLDCVGGVDHESNPFEERTEEDTTFRISLAQRTSVHTSREQALQPLREHSLKDVFIFDPKDQLKDICISCYQKDGSSTRFPMLPYAGFNLTDCCKLYVPDYLHTIQEGIVPRLIGENGNSLLERLIAKIKGRDGKHKRPTTIRRYMSKCLEISSAFPEQAGILPGSLFHYSKSRLLYGMQKSALVKTSLVACLVEPGLQPLLEVLEAFLDMDSLLSQRYFTERQVEDLRDAIIKFQTVFKRVSEDQGLQCKFPKFFILPRFATAIKMYGSSILTSTASQERTHQDLKRFARCTNNRKDFQKQINQKAIAFQYIQQTVNSHAAKSKKTRVSKQMKAIRKEVFQTPTQEDHSFTWEEINDSDEFDALCRKCPDLKQLPQTLEVILKDQVKEKNDKELSIHEVRLYGKGYLPLRKRTGYPIECCTIYSQMGKKKKMQIVQVKTGKEETWYGQVICFMRVITKSGDGTTSKNKPLVFLKWFEECDQQNSELKRYKCFQYERTQRRIQTAQGQDSHPKVDFTDSRPVREIIKPVYFQKDPRTKRKRFFLNTDV